MACDLDRTYIGGIERGEHGWADPVLNRISII